MQEDDAESDELTYLKTDLACHRQCNFVPPKLHNAVGGQVMAAGAFFVA